MKTVAISQPRYLPAINYLDRIVRADVFVLLDTCQHQPRAFEHRNRVLTSGGPTWLTIPLGRTHRARIENLRIETDEWIGSHLRTLHSHYAKAPYYDQELLNAYYDVFRAEGPFTPLIRRGLEVLLEHLGFGEDEHDLRLAHEIDAKGTRDVQLANLTRAVGGNVYISGPNGRTYIHREHFEGLEVLFHDFTWASHPQVGHDDFVPWMACVDTIFNIGTEATVRAMREGSHYVAE